MKASALARPLHVSWLVCWLCAGVTLGVICANHMSPLTFTSPLWLGVAAGLLLVALWQQKTWCLIVMVIVGGIVGSYRGGYEQRKLSVYSNFVGQELAIRGTVVEDPATDKTGLQTLILHRLTYSGRQLHGKIWVSLAKTAPLKRSDQVIVQGVLQKGFASFSASMYRAQLQKIERVSHGDLALEGRDMFAGHVEQVISSPASQLGLGLLAGEKRALPDDIATAFKIASLTHIVVASGYNLTILVRLSRRLFARVSKFLAAFISGGLVVGFIAITGNSPSMARAGLVSLLSLAAWYYGRRFHPIVILMLAAAVTLIINPSYGWNDLGWELSFLSFAGVMLLAPVMQRYFFGDKEPSTIRQIVGETLSAQAATLPLIAMNFGYVSVVGLLANLIVVPFVPLAMLLTFIAGVGAWLVPGPGHVIGLPAQALLDAMIFVSKTCASFSWARLEIVWTWQMTIVFYGALVGLGLYMWRVSRVCLRDQSIIE